MQNILEKTKSKQDPFKPAMISLTHFFVSVTKYFDQRKPKGGTIYFDLHHGKDVTVAGT